MANVFTGPWHIVRDFNTVISQNDKISGKLVASSSTSGLNGLIDDFRLIELGFNGSPFTCSNGRTKNADIQARLNRVFGNDNWRVIIPRCLPNSSLGDPIGS